MRNVHHAVLSAGFALTCVVFYDACCAGYPLRNGLAHGVFFGCFAASWIVGIALFIGMITADLLERFISLPKVLERVIRFYFHVPLSVVFLINGCKIYVDDGFEHYVSKNRPESLIIDKREMVSGFGIRIWMYAISVDPPELEKITSEWDYQVEDLSRGDPRQRLAHELSGYRELTIPQGYEEFTKVMTYHRSDDESSGSTGFMMTLYLSPSTGRVLVFGSDD